MQRVILGGKKKAFELKGFRQAISGLNTAFFLYFFLTCTFVFDEDSTYELE